MVALKALAVGTPVRVKIPTGVMKGIIQSRDERGYRVLLYSTSELPSMLVRLNLQGQGPQGTRLLSPEE